MMLCRFFVDPPADGAWNMAVDEALLEQAADEGLTALRFYTWQVPTLSLGYFQGYSERDSHPASRNAAAVRRLSGGGALMHDRELTYSLALPASHAISRRAQELYPLVHKALIETLAEHGIVAALSCEGHCQTATSGTAADEPFLCFARRSDADVVVAAPTAAKSDGKIAGSAQRRRRGSVLQHGALLMDASSCAPELPGLAQLTTSPVDPLAVLESWSSRLAARLDLRLLRTDSLASAPCQRCNDLATKHRSPSWLRRR
jgi:lipoate-protein ligase A